MARFTRFLAAGAVVVALGLAGCSSSSSDKASSDTGSSVKKTTTTAAASSDSAVSTDTGVSSDSAVSSDSGVSSDSSVSTDDGSTPSYVDGKNVTDAHAWVQDLLKAGGDVKKDQLNDPDAYAKVFSKAFPTVLTQDSFVGSAIEAPTNGISGIEAITPKQPAGLYSALGIAVKDSKGDCAAGIITISEDGTEVAKTVALPAGAKCTGEEVYKAENTF